VPQALANLRVLDISNRASGASCTRMLADFGADVLMVEAPGGHPLRHEPPFDDAGRSIPAGMFLANKRSVVLDLEDANQRTRFLSLVASADILVSSFRPSELEQLGLRYADLANDRLLMCHVTPFGMSGVRAEQPGNELMVAALSGWASLNGDAASYPLKPVGHQVALCTGVVAYGAIVAALIQRDAGGPGHEIDVAELDVMASTASPAILRGQYTGTPAPRRQAVEITSGPVPVADGHFALTISRAHFWRDAMTVLGLMDLAEDPRWEPSWYRQQHKEEYAERVGAAMATWKKADLFEELAARRVVAGPVLTMAELRASPHLAERRFWVDADGEAYPGAPFQMSGTPWELRRGAPAPGSDATGWPE